jgi:hypothetical protein
MISMPAMRNPTGDERFMDISASRHPEPPVVEKRAAPLLGREQFIRNRIIGEARDHLPSSLERH